MCSAHQLRQPQSADLPRAAAAEPLCLARDVPPELASDIVHRQGRHLVPNSQPREETTSYVWLHVSEPEAAPEPEAKPPAQYLRRVLVVEDEASIRDSLRQFLVLSGYDTRCACDGEEAEGILGDGFDLLLTDLTLGGMNGYEVARRFKEATPLGKILLLTGWPLADNASGMVDVVLTKPVSGRTVLAEVKRLLEGPMGSPAPLGQS
jgi:CheY-like chemotaxis protein